MKRQAAYSEFEENSDRRKRVPEVSNHCESPDTSSSLTTLCDLLDFSHKLDAAAVQLRFDEIAKAILHRFVLVLGTTASGDGSITNTTFEVIELEMYLWIDAVHEDPFTHGSVEQRSSGSWYFHRAPRKSEDSRKSMTAASGYRGGTRKGLDLTFGGSVTVSSPYFSATADTVSSTHARGGILLRSLRNTSTGSVISGPSLVVDEILKLSQASSIADLVDKQWRGDISALTRKENVEGKASRDSTLYLLPRTDILTDAPLIHRSPRIGLDLSHPGTSPSVDHPRAIYLPKTYRYFTHSELLTANGRPQTFLGILFSLDPTFSSRSSSRTERAMAALKDDIAKQTGLKVHTIAKYFDYYLAGYGIPRLQDFVGQAGKGASASPGTYLKLIGTLASARNALENTQS